MVEGSANSMNKSVTSLWNIPKPAAADPAAESASGPATPAGDDEDKTSKKRTHKASQGSSVKRSKRELAILSLGRRVVVVLVPARLTGQ